jgi:AcrR family transcriptional regulator
MVAQDRILETALRLFRTYGVKSVTMFDISRDSGVSKKTVYEHFRDKEELVQGTMHTILEGHVQQLRAFHETAENAIEELIKGLQYIETAARTINPVMLFEIQKYYPDTWQAIETFKRDCIFENIKTNLQRGIAEGLYRKHLQLDIITRLRQLQLESAFDPVQYPAARFDLHEVMYQVTAHFIMGIATLKGHKLANKYLQIEEDD